MLLRLRCSLAHFVLRVVLRVEPVVRVEHLLPGERAPLEVGEAGVARVGEAVERRHVDQVVDALESDASGAAASLPGRRAKKSG